MTSRLHRTLGHCVTPAPPVAAASASSAITTRHTNGATTTTKNQDNDGKRTSAPSSLPSLSSVVARPELVPFGFENPLFALAKQGRVHLRWMIQKDQLGQDMFLLGGTGPLRRWLALHFAAITKREIEYVALTRDTTETDLKQRREIVKGGTSVYIDQQVVSAALNGRLLIIEGLEKAERNVLPVLNNLLENREMALEDGRFLMAPKRYQTLLAEKKAMASSTNNPNNTTKTSGTTETITQLVPVHPNFRVIAIGVPVPPYPGNPLDPPLRSRFQSRRVDPIDTTTLMTIIRRLPPNASTNSSEYASVATSAANAPSPASASTAGLPMDRLLALLGFAESLRNVGATQAGLAGVERRAVAFHHLPYCGEAGLISAARTLRTFPRLPLLDLIHRIYPWETAVINDEAKELVRGVIDNLDRDDAIDGIKGNENHDRDDEMSNASTRGYFISSVTRAPPVMIGGHSVPHVTLSFVRHDARGTIIDTVNTTVVSGSDTPVLPTNYSGGLGQHYMLSSLLQSHVAGQDICIVSGKGEGKSFLAAQLARALGYTPVEALFLFKDMSARDLLQRRTTTNDGATVWQDTPLITAVRYGHLAILDGIHRLPLGTLSVLLRLIEDREITLYDGTRYVRYDRYQRMQSELGLDVTTLTARRIFPVHPAFRLLAMGNPPELTNPWLTNEIMNLFHWHSFALLPPPPVTSLPGVSSSSTSSVGSAPLLPSLALNKSLSIAALLQSIVPNANPALLQALQRFAHRVNDLRSDPVIQLDKVLSLRQLIRIARRSTAYEGEVSDNVANTCMLKFVPVAKRDVLLNVIKHVGLASTTFVDMAHDHSIIATSPTSVKINQDMKHGRLTIGSVSIAITPPRHPELVPDVVFFNIPRHTLHLESMLKDFILGDHLLLIGSQGVGKNKLVDRLLQLMAREREYIQLHRDTTVQSLTLSPSLEGGLVVWEDSPLVRAMQYGRILMVDEVDKAPTEVVCVLKGLLEDGEILLSDGRRFVTAKSALYHQVAAATPSLSSSSSFNGHVLNVHRVHPQFRVIALANPPGYPFLGNDFFNEMGDVFAGHAVDNPDQLSEMALLRAYAPSLTDDLLRSLTSAFADLRSLTDDGMLAYPYSTRELVNIVRHLHAYPKDHLRSVLQNVLAFDSFDDSVQTTLSEVFHKHGIPAFGTSLANGMRGGVHDASHDIGLASSFSLPPPLLIARILRDDFSAYSSTMSRDGRIPLVMSPRELQRWAPQHAADTPIVLVEDERDKAERLIKQAAQAKVANDVARVAKGEGGRLIQAAAPVAPATTDEYKVEWKLVDRHFSSRAIRFTEELYHYRHRTGTIVDACVSDGLLHVLSTWPFALSSYDVTAAAPRPMVATVTLTNTIHRAWGNDDFRPRPVMCAVPCIGRVVVYQPHFAVALLVDARSHHVIPLSVSLDPQRQHLDRYMDIDPNAAVGVISSLAAFGVVGLYFIGAHIITFIAIGTRPYHSYTLTLPSSMKIRRVDAVYHDRFIIRDQNDHHYDCVLHGLPSLTNYSPSSTVPPPPFTVTHAIIQDVMYEMAQSPALSARHSAITSSPLAEGAPKVVQSLHHEQMTAAISAPPPSSIASFLGKRDATTPATAPVFIASSSKESVSAHALVTSDLVAGFILSYPSSRVVVPKKTNASSRHAPFAHVWGYARVPPKDLPLLDDDAKPLTIPPSTKASSSSLSSSPPPSVTFAGPFFENALRPRSRLEYITTCYMSSSNYLVTAMSYDNESLLEVVDLTAASMRVIIVPRVTNMAQDQKQKDDTPLIRSAASSTSSGGTSGGNGVRAREATRHYITHIHELSDGRLVVIQNGGTIRVYELRPSVLDEQRRAWLAMFGDVEQDDDDLPTVRPQPPPENKDSKEQRPPQSAPTPDGEKDDAHHDSNGQGGNGGNTEGNTPTDGSPNGGGGSEGNGSGNGKGSGGSGGDGSGGTGGSGTGGSGGSGGGGGGNGGKGFSGGPQDMEFNQTKETTPRDLLQPKRAKPKVVTAAEMTENELAVKRVVSQAADAAKKAVTKQLDSKKNRVGLDHDVYQRLYNAVAKQISQLRVILEGAEAKERERTWVKNQTAGELDDNRLVDGATGERNIYKKRGNEDPMFGMIQKRPKRLRFVMDVSSSMSVFNGTDRRLDRMVATTVMIMEAFDGFQHKYDYSIVGHDGESPLIPFVSWGQPPRTQQQRLDVIEMMYWNASFCSSGDHTLAAAHHAVSEVTRDIADDYFVFVLSDANLGRYGISPSALAAVLLSDRRVNTYAIFIAGENEGKWLNQSLPLGHGYVCTDTAMLPRIFKEIFTSSLLQNRAQSKL